MRVTKTMKWLAAALLILPWAGARCAAEGPADQPFLEQVFLSEEAALKAVFPDADRVAHEGHAFTPREKQDIESKLGWIVPESSVTVHSGYKGSRLLGRAVITQEIGKFKPITFIVAVSPEGKVQRVEVLVYREAVGAEVRRERFMYQFKGKSARDSLRINRDIINVTGATMSVEAITAGVKKVLIILDRLYPKP